MGVFILSSTYIIVIYIEVSSCAGNGIFLGFCSVSYIVEVEVEKHRTW